jgi:hypothetical protein
LPGSRRWRPSAFPAGLFGSVRYSPAVGGQLSFAGTTVESIVLEISHQHPRLRPGARTGVWCATKLATDAGGWRQVNRAGHPMMWPIFWPGDTDFSNSANTRHRSEDFAAAGKYSATRWPPSWPPAGSPRQQLPVRRADLTIAFPSRPP